MVRILVEHIFEADTGIIPVKCKRHKGNKGDFCAYEQDEHFLDVNLELKAMISVHLLHVRQNCGIVVGKVEDQNYQPVKVELEKILQRSIRTFE